jgi:hypothetical protein
MRFIVLFFGFLAVLLTASAGAVFLAADVMLEDLRHQAGFEIPQWVLESPIGTPHGETAVFLLVAAAYGLIGTFIAFGRAGWQGALLMLVPILGAAFLNPYSLVFTGLQAFTALLAFFVKPLPIEEKEPANDSKGKSKKKDDDDDDEDAKPAKGKRKDEDDEEEPAPKKPSKSKYSDDDEDEEPEPRKLAKAKKKDDDD